MKHIFVVNPVSGKGVIAKAYIPTIENYIKEHNLDAEIYVTKASRDGLHFVEEKAKTGEEIRFYSCGGDGTLYEVVNGCYKYPNCQVANIPLGSGNDFCRLFGKNTNLSDHVNGIPVKLDLIETDGVVAINECAMGLDSEICIRQLAYKKIPGVNGELAYTLAGLGCLAQGKTKNYFKITIDDNEVFEDTYLFCYIGNSRWYGGGYKPAPNAMPNDGFIDCVMVRCDRSALRLVPLISVYKKGDHLDLDITTVRRCKKVKVESRNPAAVNIDGECEYVTEKEFKLLEKAITFVVPRNSDFLNM
ncbi:MAG: hypothetical protein IKW45_02335 [Clostridia bacterium]|nr:hypothetical protein [Clostridia bacterium]